MSYYPDFSTSGYQVISKLGHNSMGGRVTYLATDTKTQGMVVIKQFQFAQLGTSWTEYDAYEQEITMLRYLNYPGIPRYLDSFQTPDGFCMVQEYIDAQSLAIPRNWTPEQIKQIAVAILKILVDLQSENPSVIHRDIKPENILVDQQMKAYLVDFGFAKMGGEEVAKSSVIKGTLGFMPPEQLFNRQLTEASDLYGLGATLICLLTHTKSTEIGNLIDGVNRIHFQHLLPQLNPQFINWLQKMVAPNLKHRYPNAAIALAAIQSIDIIGNAFNFGKLVSAIKTRFTIPVLGLATLSVFAFLGTKFVISSMTISQNMETPQNAVRQLLETHQCRGCNLMGADLSGMNLKGFDLTDADLRGANLRNTDLRSSLLENVNLTNADLRNADLRGVYLDGADLTDANLEGANLKTADLRRAIIPDGFMYP